jgi:hypothetical protein
MTRSKDPYRFKEVTQQDSETDRRAALEEHYESSPLTSVEKLHNFPRFVPRATLTRFLSRTECFKKVLHVQGSVMDCGVLFGSSLMTWARLSSILEPLNSQRKIVGFDTFQGFPRLGEQDKTGSSVQSHAGGFDFQDDRIYDDLVESVTHYDADRQLGHIPKVEVVRGDVTKTIPAYLEDNPHTLVSLLHLDLDIYEPTKMALEHFVPRMPKGAVIVFDELNAPLWPGETIALLDTLGVRDLRIERFSWDTYLSYAVLD